MLFPPLLAVRRRHSGSLALLFILSCTLFVILRSYEEYTKMYIKQMSINNSIFITSLQLHKSILDGFYESHKSFNTSKLGAVLFKNEKYPLISKNKRNRTFVILIWSHWKFLKRRHVFYFGRTRHNPLEGCSVKNCVFTGKNRKMPEADAVLVHMSSSLPPVEFRNQSQRWIFLNDEAPHNAFTLSRRRRDYKNYHNLFNWSMTYRTESDVPVPYGRTIPLIAPKFPYKNVSLANLVPNYENKTRNTLVAILISNCGVPYRLKLVKKLQSYIDVDVRGKCGSEFRNSCPGNKGSDCKVLTKYLFYLVLENSLCKEYMTEKLFYNAYYRGAIPIIQGPTFEECETFLPPNSFLHIDSYETIEDLANDITRISKDDNELLKYHLWRNHFDIANEHGYFKTKSFHLCRLCEAMNYNDDRESVYSTRDLDRFLHSKTLCRKPVNSYS